MQFVNFQMVKISLNSYFDNRTLQDNGIYLNFIVNFFLTLILFILVCTQAMKFAAYSCIDFAFVNQF